MLFSSCLLSLVFAQSILSLENNYLPVFSSSKTYFGQSDPKIPTKDVNLTRFGLLPEYTWDQVVQSLAPDEKLFFLQRHGQGWHNIARSYLKIPYSEWQCYWSIRDGKDGIEWYDADLTPKGKEQIAHLVDQIKNTEDFPLPEKFYVSPLRRTLKTWQLTWLNFPHKTALIKEYAREIYGIDTESERHNRTYIEENFPNFDFEPGFSEEDVNWSPSKREEGQHSEFRAATLLRDIFNDAQDEKVISIVLHSGIIYSILDVVQHRIFSIPTGGIIPVIVKMEQQNKTYPLNDAFSGFDEWCPPSLESDFKIERTRGANHTVEKNIKE
ncbi:hypothetical protein KGF56_000570 [Candida oxycetoniae]|uniref:Phosphomutase n=1 Tax=Candida oxycetoniae TaxID=497107 RepID=A0AAI9T183_9ASCO|nr:uncharacterized protein KGF56_000570 [Candida oxycetoniae]KAI3406724.1 hypothetical protein KGF56_000570 [Candida oxycetoniae]